MCGQREKERRRGWVGAIFFQRKRNNFLEKPYDKTSSKCLTFNGSVTQYFAV